MAVPLQTQRLQREMRAEHDFAMRELQDSGRRLREDCAHQVELERSKVRQQEEEHCRLQQQVGAGGREARRVGGGARLTGEAGSAERVGRLTSRTPFCGG